MNRFGYLPLPVLVFGLVFSGAALAQGIGEYGAVMGLPKPVPNASTMGNSLNKLYGAPGRALNTTPSGTGGGRAATKGAPAKAGTPAIGATIKSGDLPGAREAAAKEQFLALSRQASETLNKGLAAKDAGKFDEAEPLLRKSANIRMNYWSDRDKLIPDILVHLGEVNSKRGQDKQASEDLQQALSYYGKFFGPGSDHRIKPLLLLSEVNERMGEKVAAYESYKQAFLLSERARLDQYNPVEMRVRAAKMALSVDKFREALDMYEKAVSEPSRSKLTRDQLLEAMDDYAVALKGLNRNRDADAILAEAEKIRNAQSSK